MNERLKELRKSLSLSMEAFGEQIGLNKASISRMESGAMEIADRTVKAICMAFHVREQWLRTGEGEMYEPDKPENSVDLFLKANGIADLEAELVKAYLELSPELRKAFIDHFKAYFERKKAAQAASGTPPDESEAQAQGGQR